MQFKKHLNMAYETNFKRRIFQDEVFLNRLVQSAFNQVDKDHSGEIDFDEFKLLVLDIAKKGNIEQPSETETRAIFDNLDTDKSGNIGLDEFKYLILRIIDMD